MIKIIKTGISFLLLVVFVLCSSCMKKDPVITASYMESTVTDGEIIFTININEASTYDIDFGDGNSSVGNSIGSPASFELNHTYEKNGKYSVVISAKNGKRHTSSYTLDITVSSLPGIIFDVRLTGYSTKTEYSTFPTSRKTNGLYVIRGIYGRSNNTDEFIEILFPTSVIAGTTLYNKQPPYANCDIDYVDYHTYITQVSMFASDVSGSCKFYISEITSTYIKGTFIGSIANAGIKVNGIPISGSISNGKFYAKL